MTPFVDARRVAGPPLLPVESGLDAETPRPSGDALAWSVAAGEVGLGRGGEDDDEGDDVSVVGQPAALPAVPLAPSVPLAPALPCHEPRTVCPAGEPGLDRRGSLGANRETPTPRARAAPVPDLAAEGAGPSPAAAEDALRAAAARPGERRLVAAARTGARPFVPVTDGTPAAAAAPHPSSGDTRLPCGETAPSPVPPPIVRTAPPHFVAGDRTHLAGDPSRALSAPAAQCATGLVVSPAQARARAPRPLPDERSPAAPSPRERGTTQGLAGQVVPRLAQLVPLVAGRAPTVPLAGPLPLEVEPAPTLGNPAGTPLVAQAEQSLAAASALGTRQSAVSAAGPGDAPGDLGPARRTAVSSPSKAASPAAPWGEPHADELEPSVLPHAGMEGQPAPRLRAEPGVVSERPILEIPRFRVVAPCPVGPVVAAAPRDLGARELARGRVVSAPPRTPATGPSGAPRPTRGDRGGEAMALALAAGHDVPIAPEPPNVSPSDGAPDPEPAPLPPAGGAPHALVAGPPTPPRCTALRPELFAPATLPPDPSDAASRAEPDARGGPGAATAASRVRRRVTAGVPLVEQSPEALLLDASRPPPGAVAARSASAAEARPAHPSATDSAPDPGGLERSHGAHHAALRAPIAATVEVPELGRILVRARTRRGEVEVEVRAAETSSAAVLQSAAPAMERDLASARVPLGSLVVTTEAGTRGQGQGHGRDHEPPRPAKGDAPPHEAPPVRPPRPTASVVPGSRRVRIVL